MKNNNGFILNFIQIYGNNPSFCVLNNFYWI